MGPPFASECKTLMPVTPPPARKGGLVRLSTLSIDDIQGLFVRGSGVVEIASGVAAAFGVANAYEPMPPDDGVITRRDGRD